MTRAIIFDFFGVICPDLYWYFLGKHVKNLESKRDFFQNLSNQHDKGVLPKQEFIRAISENTGVDEKNVLAEMNGAAIVDLELTNLIRALKENYKIGVLSNSGVYFIDKIFQENNLKGLFDSIIVSERVGVIKPQPEIFKIILDELEVSAGEVLFIDDRERNTVAAQKLGIKSFVYTTLEKLKRDLVKENIKI
jgi:HAD superfamily hydrolase (TIGR01509 family)